MALSTTLTETSICNRALGKIGSLRITGNVETEDSIQAIQCRFHYEATRDSLEQSYPWRFTSDRETLTVSADTPDFEWDYQFPLPDDFLAMRSIYEDRFSDENIRNYALEGTMLLTNESTMEIRYVKKVTDVSKFDPLFTKVLVLLLADELIIPLAGGDKHIMGKLERQLDELMPDVRARSAQEMNTAGRNESGTWNDAMYGGRDPMRL